MNQTDNYTSVCTNVIEDLVTPEYLQLLSLAFLIAHGFFYLLGAFLVFLRRKTYPIRRSGIEYTVISGFAAFLSTVFTSGREYVGRANLSCDLYLWLFMIAFPLYVTPLAIRFRLLALRIEWNNMVKDIPLFIESSTDMHALRKRKTRIGGKYGAGMLLIGVGFISAVGGVEYTIADNMGKGCTGCLLQLRELAAVLIISVMMAVPVLFYCIRLYRITSDQSDFKWFVISVVVSLITVIIWFAFDFIDPWDLHATNQINWGVINSGGLALASFMAMYMPVWKSIMVERGRSKSFDSQSLDSTDPETAKMTEYLKTEEGYQAFAEYLAKEYSTETIRFWREATRWRMQSSLGSGATEMSAQEIFDIFLDESGMLQVNVSAAVRENIEEQLSEAGSDPLPAGLFDGAIQEVFHLMKYDSWPRFQRSDLYQEKRKLGVKRLIPRFKAKFSDVDSVRTGLTAGSFDTLDP